MRPRGDVNEHPWHSYMDLLAARQSSISMNARCEQVVIRLTAAAPKKPGGGWAPGGGGRVSLYTGRASSAASGVRNKTPLILVHKGQFDNSSSWCRAGDAD
jgi:hypothetical protein